MKKLILLLVMLSASSFAWSQGVVEGLASKVSSSTVSFDYSYLIKIQLNMRGSGHITVQGDAFRMEGDGIVICCDGSTRWTADEEAKELIIESVEGGYSAFAVNPALMIGALDSAFTLTDNGGGSYTLIPKSETDIQLLRLNFKGDKLYSASMTLSDGTIADFTISNMKFSAPSSPSFFSYPEVDSSWVVTDLR